MDWKGYFPFKYEKTSGVGDMKEGHWFCESFEWSKE